MKSHKNITKPLTLILLFALVLRLFRYTFESIWLDESVSIFIAQQSFVEVITFIDPTPPLFYILLHIWNYVSISEAWLKLLPLLLSLATVYIVYLIGKELYSHKAGLIASLFVAISPIQIFYAQELRAYSLLFFVTSTLIYFYLTYNKSKKHKIGYILFFIATVYTHIYGIFILLAIQFHKLIVEKKKYFTDKYWFIIHIGLTLLSTPWLYKIYYMVQIGEAGWIQIPQLKDILFTFVQSIGGPSAFIPSTISSIIGLFLLGYSCKSISKNKLIYLWILFPIVIPFVLSLFMRPFFYPRYALLISIPLFILFSQTILQMKIKKIVLPLFAILLISIVFIQAYSIEKDPWNQIHKAELEKPIGFIAYYEAFPYIYYAQPDCFSKQSIDDVYLCAAQKEIYAIQKEYPPNNKINTFVLSKYWLTEEDTQLYEEYVPLNVSKKTYDINTDVGIFKNYARSQPIYVVQP